MEKLPGDIFNIFYGLIGIKQYGRLCLTSKTCLRMMNRHKWEIATLKTFRSYKRHPADIKSEKDWEDRHNELKIRTSPVTIEVCDIDHIYSVTAPLRRFLCLDSYGLESYCRRSTILKYIDMYIRLNKLRPKGIITLNKELRSLFFSYRHSIQKPFHNMKTIQDIDDELGYYINRAPSEVPDPSAYEEALDKIELMFILRNVFKKKKRDGIEVKSSITIDEIKEMWMESGFIISGPDSTKK